CIEPHLKPKTAWPNRPSYEIVLDVTNGEFYHILDVEDVAAVMDSFNIFCASKNDVTIEILERQPGQSHTEYWSKKWNPQWVSQSNMVVCSDDYQAGTYRGRVVLHHVK